ncbi:hypothetical protein [Polaribacter sp. IC073]|uniref:hypothetical protein n=1 Tax=Polaribacter sp. IC073 TaxID=2508540 RepID=UPI0011BE37A2|nr:hypothetical protein [Polaribacter sp. IC073]TXD48633.1 hypothetical protein ES045_05255 [Polaribacter sp. IC073]
MKTIIELEKKITSITAKIHSEYPELSKYITEIPVNNLEGNDVNIKNLQDYYDSLEEILNNYAHTHKQE